MIFEPVSQQIVLMRPHFFPALLITERTRKATVVLPFVPVTARLVSFEAGLPREVCARTAAAVAESSTVTTSAFFVLYGFCVTIYFAPASIAFSMKSIAVV